MNQILGFLVYDAKRSFRVGFWFFLLLVAYGLTDSISGDFHMHSVADYVLFFIKAFIVAEIFVFVGRCLLWVIFLVIRKKYRVTDILTNKFEADLYDAYTAKMTK